MRCTLRQCVNAVDKMQQQRHFVCAVTVYDAAMCEQGESLDYHSQYNLYSY